MICAAQISISSLFEQAFPFKQRTNDKTNDKNTIFLIFLAKKWLVFSRFVWEERAVFEELGTKIGVFLPKLTDANILKKLN